MDCSDLRLTDGGELAAVRSRMPQLQPSFSKAYFAAKMLYLHLFVLCLFVLYLFDVSFFVLVENRCDLIWSFPLAFSMLIG